MPSARTHHTPNACTPKPRSYNQMFRNLPESKSSEETLKDVQKAHHSRNPSLFSDSKHFVCSTCQKCVFNANHDACITKFLKEVNSRVRVQSPKTRNINKLVEPKIHTQKPSRQIVTGHRFSPNKSSDVHEKTNTPRSCLRWIPTGRIFNTIGLRWVPTRKTFTSITTKVDCKPINGSNEDITNPYECDQTLNVSAEAAALRAEVLADSPMSTSIDQDAPSISIPSSQEYEQSLIISQGFEESPKTPTFHDDPLNESPNEDSTPQESSSNVRQIHTPFEHLGRWTKDHPIANLISDPSRCVSTRKQLETDTMWCYFDAFFTSVEPKNFKQAMTEPSWIDAMQEEIYKFERIEVWELVPCPDNVFLIKLKWIYKVKTDESGGVLKNKARLLKKALYGLKQAPRAWYDMLPSFLISQQFSKGVVDPTLFTRHAGNGILLVQIYVDDIIFALSNTAMCDEFAHQMTNKFNMSMMGQMSFFLGLQISQSPRGVFINQSKYASKIVKKYSLHSIDSVDTPMIKNKKLDEDIQGKPVDATLYRGMIRSLMYLTSSRPDLYHDVCLYARTINMGLWYSKDTDMLLTAYVDADHAGCQDTRRSTSGSTQFLGDKLVSWSSKKQRSTAISSTEAKYIALSGAKHIDIRYHFIKKQVENGIVELYFVRTEYQLADIFTKPLPRERFNFLIDKLGMKSMSQETLRCLTEEMDE
ncbi:retrovirus-related pol polyprotein from transposon TNT 1-94 [Tanacetum coccineum]|uniref:Retrovirus-related pol polyprotein from transposon TNT 1-94 n=1 Tax=Tanacetum coccineum TaxID=301880 RepID=A0ABQ5B0U0_9ASTR